MSGRSRVTNTLQGDYLGMKEAKYHRDLELIVDKVLQVRYEDYHKESQECR
jgi:hypothetical protein